MHSERGWTAWRLGVLVVGTVLLAPVVFPLIEIVQHPGAWKVWTEWDRMAPMLGNTLLIVVGSSLLAVALGGVVAVLLMRTTLRGKWFWGMLLSAGLFIPLPMLLSGWYLVAQGGGAALPALWPYEARVFGTLFIHGMLGLPWAILVLSLGLLWIEPELEEEMLLYASFPAVMRRIILPRCWPFVGMAALLVSWPTWHEITVTDFFKVRTFAEEVYLRLNDGSVEEAPHAVATVLPLCVIMVLLAIGMMRWWRERCPPGWPSNARQRHYQLGRWQILGQLWMFVVAGVLLIIPCTGLVMRAGMEYGGPGGATWSFAATIHRVGLVLTSQWHMLMQSLGMAALAGIVTTISSVLLVWLARSSRRLETSFWWLAAILWSLPGPIIGLGLLSFILVLLPLPGGFIWSAWLYSEPSPIPNIWSAWLRFLPLAWLALWPMARLIPKEWDEVAGLDGASPWHRLRVIYWPSLWRPALGIALGVALLTLGEISASKLVTTPGYLPLSHHLFQQLHAGADTEVAALSLTLLLPVVVTILGTGLMVWWRRR